MGTACCAPAERDQADRLELRVRVIASGMASLSASPAGCNGERSLRGLPTMREHFAMQCLEMAFAVVAIGLSFLFADRCSRHRPLRAAGLDEALAHFTADDFSETEAGINGGRGERRSARRHHHRGAAGRPAALQRRTEEGLLQGRRRQAVRCRDRRRSRGHRRRPISTRCGINNRLRRAIDAALGGLTLMSPDPAKRYDAAQAVFKSHEASVLPAVEAAIAKETNPRIKRALIEAPRRHHRSIRTTPAKPTSSPPSR